MTISDLMQHLSEYLGDRGPGLWRGRETDDAGHRFLDDTPMCGWPVTTRGWIGLAIQKESIGNL